MNKKNFLTWFSLIFLMFLTGFLLLYFFNYSEAINRSMNFLLENIESKNIESLKIYGTTIFGVLKKDNIEFRTVCPDNTMVSNFVQEALNNKIQTYTISPIGLYSQTRNIFWEFVLSALNTLIFVTTLLWAHS